MDFGGRKVVCSGKVGFSAKMGWLIRTRDLAGIGLHPQFVMRRSSQGAVLKIKCNGKLLKIELGIMKNGLPGYDIVVIPP